MQRHRRFNIKLLLILLAPLVFLVAAQEEGLYAPAPPADAAFVRVLNASTGGETASSLGNTDFEALPYGAVSPYRVVMQGAAELSGGSVSETVEVAAGRFYTVVLGDAVTLIEDPTLENRAQALLTLYNTSEKPVNLKTADGATAVIPDVPSGEVGSIAVNPVAAAFGVFAGETAITAFNEVQLGRGAVYSTFVLPDDTAVFVQNTTATE